MPNNEVFSPITQDAFRNAMSDLPAAVSLVTTVDNDGVPRGATVSAVSSLSLDPPLILICLDESSDTLEALPLGQSFLLHVAADGQQEAAMKLAKKGVEKFDSIRWTPVRDGLPLVEGYSIAFHCEVEHLLPGGDHTIVAGRILEIAYDPSKNAIVYHRRQMFPTPASSVSLSA